MTRRAIIIGVVAVIIIGLFTPYSDLVMRGTWVGLTAFPINALFMLLATIGGLNTLLRRFGKGLARGELLLVYSMSLVAGGIPSFGLTGLLIPYIAGPFYFARPENRFEQVLHPLIPKWMHPQSDYAIQKLYEGLREGQSIPWGEWVVPLLAWSALASIMYFAFFCLTSLLRKRWVEDEKLVFPLLQLPVEMSTYQGDKNRPAFLRDGVMWGFFAIPFLIHALNGLHHYIPGIPTINVHEINLGQYLAQRPWNAATPLYMRILFSIIGLAYVLPSELSFSLWFFHFFFLAQAVTASAMGIPMKGVQAYGTKELIAHQMWGGILTSAVLGLIAARPRLEQIYQQAFHKKGTLDDSNEPMPYRLAIYGLGACLLALGLWGSAAGASFLPVIGLMVLFFLSHIVAVRLVCEGGMLYVQHPFRPFNMLLAGFGSRGLGANNIAILGYLDHLWMVDNRSPLMPGIMQSMKLADEGNISRRALAKTLALSIVLAVVTSYFSYLRLMYRHGGANLHEWFTTYYTRNLYSNWTMQLLEAGEPAKLTSFITMGAGSVSLWGLTLLHHTFLWWPLHPIGYLMGASWPMINFWFPIFIGWLCKTTILRYGGPKVYRRLLPGFLGLVLAEFAAAGIWILIDFIAGVRGHLVFSF